MIDRPSWRDRLVSGLALVMLAVVIWLIVGFASEDRKAHDSGFECMPVCHYCAEVAGSTQGPGPKPLSRHCVKDCVECSHAREAARHLDAVLLGIGGMEPG